MKNSLNKNNKTGDQALLFDSRYKKFKGKLTTRWMGPYEIVTNLIMDL